MTNVTCTMTLAALLVAFQTNSRGDSVSSPLVERFEKGAAPPKIWVVNIPD